MTPASSFSRALGCSPRNEAGQATLATVYPFSLSLFLPLQLLFVIQRQTPLQLSPLLQLYTCFLCLFPNSACPVKLIARMFLGCCESKQPIRIRKRATGVSQTHGRVPSAKRRQQHVSSTSPRWKSPYG